jgi:hypothetical protein
MDEHIESAEVREGPDGEQYQRIVLKGSKRVYWFQCGDRIHFERIDGDNIIIGEPEPTMQQLMDKLIEIERRVEELGK